jgi:PAS domain S-box-containing protein
MSRLARPAPVADFDRTQVWDQMFQQATYGIAVVESSSERFFFANSAMARMLGRTPAELIGMRVVDLFPEEEQTRLKALVPVRDANGILVFESVFRRKDGSLLPVEVRVNVVYDAQRRDIYRVSFATDISERKRLEAERDATRRRADEAAALLNTLLDQSPVAFGFLDRDCRYIRLNQALADILGRDVEACVGRPLSELLPGMWSQVSGVYRRVIDEGIASVNIEQTGPLPGRPDPETTVLVSRYPVFVGDTVMGIGLVIVDITRQRQMEAQLRQAMKMEAIGNLTGGIAHDFNNLLAVIVGNLDIVGTMVPRSGEVAGLVDSAFGAAQRGAELTRRLLAYARRQPLRPEAVRTNALVEELHRMLGRTLGSNIEIALDLAADVSAVLADPTQLEAALLNLCTNARDAMPRGGRVTLSTRNARVAPAQDAEMAPGDYVVIEVRDTGTGMTPEVAAQVFEPFFTTKELGKGTGLGLSMVFGFVKQSGGHIQLDSAPGQGAAFRLFFPAATAEAVAPPVPPQPAPARGGETVLVVEDNVPLRELVARQLAGFGYRVLEAERADRALELLAREDVDLLFTDVILPGGTDGIALAERVLAQWPQTRVLLSTGYPDLRLPGRADGPAAAHLLVKPYRTAALGEAVRAALDAPAP